MPKEILHLVIPGLASATVYEGSVAAPFLVATTFRRQGAKRVAKKEKKAVSRELAVYLANNHMLDACHALGMTTGVVEEVTL